MLITTAEGVTLSLTRDELTVLRRNVALYYRKETYRAPDGEIITEADRRPPWSTFQQRLVSPEEVRFVSANPLTEAEFARVTARCLNNLEKANEEAEEEFEFTELLSFAKEREFDLDDRKEQLYACERLSWRIARSGLLSPEANYLVLAYCDLHLLMFELDRFVYQEFDERNDREYREKQLAKAAKTLRGSGKQDRLLRH